MTYQSFVAALGIVAVFGCKAMGHKGGSGHISNSATTAANSVELLISDNNLAAYTNPQIILGDEASNEIVIASSLSTGTPESRVAISIEILPAPTANLKANPLTPIDVDVAGSSLTLNEATDDGYSLYQVLSMKPDDRVIVKISGTNQPGFKGGEIRAFVRSMLPADFKKYHNGGSSEAFNLGGFKPVDFDLQYWNDSLYAETKANASSRWQGFRLNEPMRVTFRLRRFPRTIRSLKGWTPDCSGVKISAVFPTYERTFIPETRCLGFPGEMEVYLDYLYQNSGLPKLSIQVKDDPEYYTVGQVDISNFASIAELSDPPPQKTPNGTIYEVTKESDGDGVRIFQDFTTGSEIVANYQPGGDLKIDGDVRIYSHLPFPTDPPGGTNEEDLASYARSFNLQSFAFGTTKNLTRDEAREIRLFTDKGGKIQFKLSNTIPAPPKTSVAMRVFFTTQIAQIPALTKTSLDTFPVGQSGIFDFEPVVPGSPVPYIDPKYYDIDASKEVTKPGSFKSDLTSNGFEVFDKKSFPAKEVILALEEIRAHLHETIQRGAQRTSANWVSQEKIDNCLSNQAPHWSDLTLHYYCQLGNARECYTTKIRTAASEYKSKAAAIQFDATGSPRPQASWTPTEIATLQEIQKDLKGLRSMAFEFCKTQAINARDSGKAIDPTSIEGEWLWLIESKVRENVFRYLMEMPTFGIDYDVQQRILNAYYRVSDDFKADPSTNSRTFTKLCQEKRPVRELEIRSESGNSKNPDGTQCSPKKELLQGQKAAGR